MTHHEGHLGAPAGGMSKGATAASGRPERRGVWGAMSGPRREGVNRGASRLRRDVPSVGGVWGAMSGPPMG